MVPIKLSNLPAMARICGGCQKSRAEIGDCSDLRVESASLLPAVWKLKVWDWLGKEDRATAKAESCRRGQTKKRRWQETDPFSTRGLCIRRFRISSLICFTWDYLRTSINGEKLWVIRFTAQAIDKASTH